MQCHSKESSCYCMVLQTNMAGYCLGQTLFGGRDEAFRKAHPVGVYVTGQDDGVVLHPTERLVSTAPAARWLIGSSSSSGMCS